MTLEQFASDAIEVTNYLRDRFNKEKIYIIAHSGGTAFSRLNQRYPAKNMAFIAARLQKPIKVNSPVSIVIC